jgi:hypothetical protein
MLTFRFKSEAPGRNSGNVSGQIAGGSGSATRCLQSDDDRIAMMAAQAILDRGYGRPTQSIDANINEDGGSVRYIAEVPIKDETTEEWLKGNAAYLASTKPGGEA